MLETHEALEHGRLAADLGPGVVEGRGRIVHEADLALAVVAEARRLENRGSADDLGGGGRRAARWAVGA